MTDTLNTNVGEAQRNEVVVTMDGRDIAIPLDSLGVTIQSSDREILDAIRPIMRTREGFEVPEEPGGSKPQLTEVWGEIDNWNSWKWQLSHSIKSSRELKQILSCKGIPVPELLEQTESIFPLAITPYYFSLIKEFNYNDPVFSMCIPNALELKNPSFLKDDPLHEEEDTVVDGLVHRYADRALIISTSQCAVYCRHCTRKRVAGCRDYHLSDLQLDKIIEYLTIHEEIRDVIISGGDPFTMSTRKLENIISKIRSVKSVEIIRIGTRTPVTLPQRITSELVNMINRYHPVFVNTHFNHPNEITEESQKACLKMIEKGIPVNNQSVLLKGINDNPIVMAELCQKLLTFRVKPYYLFSCDLVKGTEHFRTPIDKGLEIMEYLRGRVSGLAIPHFIIDAPEGKGKIPILPNYIVNRNSTGITLRNYKGEEVFYPEPEIR